MQNTTNENKKTTNDNYNFQSPSTGKKFDPAKVLDEIQTEMKNLQYDAGGLLSDGKDIADMNTEIASCLGGLELLIEGLHYLRQNTGLGDHLSDDKMLAIYDTFYHLKELIQIREREHSFIWNMSFHGEGNPN